VGRKNNLKVNESLNFRSFDIGTPVFDKRNSDKNYFKNYYRHFKVDLALRSSTLKSPEGKKWEMKTRATDGDRTHGGQGEILKQGSDGVYYFFNPETAAYVFLRKLCAQAVKRAAEISGIDDGIKVHITAPAYANTDRERSQRYRDRIRDIVEKFKNERIFSGVNFVVGQHDFLYEPYGVYYYYAFLQQSVAAGEGAEGNTYLIFDMGGSTTDLAFVQISGTGKLTRAYPICKSINLAGAYFDQFLLKVLRGEKTVRRVSAKWNPEFEKIERAKIALCKGDKDEVTLDIKGKEHVLTRDIIANALIELWNDDNQPLAQGFRGFLDEAHKYARSNSLFLEFEKIEKVFLAGGSTGLPGLKNLILSTLKSSRFNLVEEDTSVDDLFEEPTLASSSSVAALGQAAEIANVEAPLVLSRAEKLFARIEDDEGRGFVFRRKSAPLGIQKSKKDREESFMFSVEEIKDRLSDKKDWVEFEKSEFQNHTPKDDQSFPNKINVYLRTDITEYPDTPSFSEQVKEGLENEAKKQKKIWYTSSYKAQCDEDTVRVRPFVYLDHIHADAPIRLYSNQGSERVSLKPQKDDGKVHICIDLGMNNTAVALCTPGQPLPEGIDEFSIIRPSQEKDMHGDESSISGDGTVSSSETTTSVHNPVEAQAENAPVLQLPDEVVQALLKVLNQVGDQEGKASADIDKILDTLRSSVQDAEKKIEKIENAIKELREAQAASDSDQRTSSRHPKKRIREAVKDNEHGFATARTAEDDFESFVKFVNKHERKLHYPTSILSAVWMHAKSDNNRLAILAGPPGCGKSSLVELVAEFFNRDQGDEWTAYYLLQPVSPTWFSPSSLLGTYSEIDGQYHSTEFLRLMMTAELHHEYVKDSGTSRLFFACLDEFNLAQPEQYMADLLSKMEAKSSKKIMLCRKDKMGWVDDLGVELTPNLKLFATINTDVSTKVLSPKVLDRSVFIRLTPTFDDLKEVSEYYAKSHEVNNVHEALFEEKGPREKEEDEPLSLFGDLVMIGKYGQSPVGYRVLQQIYEYASQHPRLERDLEGVIDEIICNFFLPKLPGSHAAANPVKYTDAVSEEQAGRVHGYPKASQILKLIKGGVPGQTAI
jgi:vacuolar-type H+-ATPase subunit H